MRIPSSIFSLVLQLIGCNACDTKRAAPRAGERADPKISPDRDPKISLCTEYRFEETTEVPQRMGNTDFVTTRSVTRHESGAVCTDPKNNFEAAEQALNLKILELGKSRRAFREEAGARTVKFCADVGWERTGRNVPAADKRFNSEVIPLIYREKKEICGEGSGLEAAQARWQAAAIEFVHRHLHYRYRNAGFQGVADEVKKKLEWLEKIPDPKPGGRIF